MESLPGNQPDAQAKAMTMPATAAMESIAAKGGRTGMQPAAGSAL